MNYNDLLLKSHHPIGAYNILQFSGIRLPSASFGPQSHSGTHHGNVAKRIGGLFSSREGEQAMQRKQIVYILSPYFPVHFFSSIDHCHFRKISDQMIENTKDKHTKRIPAVLTPMYPNSSSQSDHKIKDLIQTEPQNPKSNDKPKCNSIDYNDWITPD